jgi:hypothetical protein
MSDFLLLRGKIYPLTNPFLGTGIAEPSALFGAARSYFTHVKGIVAFIKQSLETVWQKSLL